MSDATVGSREVDGASGELFLSPFLGGSAPKWKTASLPLNVCANHRTHNRRSLSETFSSASNCLSLFGAEVTGLWRLREPAIWLLQFEFSLDGRSRCVQELDRKR